MPYFLDGNNLIGRARRTSMPTEADRAALVTEVAERLRRSRASAVLFFDGAGERSSTLGSLSIRAAGGSADEAILREIARSRAPAEIVVVTADRDLSRRARDLGAKASSPEDFWRRVGTGGGQAQKETTIDVEDWMKYFEDEGNRRK
ncbi:MAG TPA: NYN domain-containing protein [Thermoanaerobaculia bacterium]|nr:NYN domain-containing protein [Thermoanaerobaculia bacterium]